LGANTRTLLSERGEEAAVSLAGQFNYPEQGKCGFVHPDLVPQQRSQLVACPIRKSKLGDLVASSDPSRWQETLAILSTYGQSDEFPSLCIALGDRLEESGDEKNASLCHMCSLSLDRAVKHWRSQLEVAIKVKGGMDFLALHEFVVKVTVFLKAVDPSTSLDPEVAGLFSTYAAALAEQGLLVTAAQYCKGDSEESRILRDKLYRSRESPMCLQALGSAPEFPFSLSAVNKAPSNASNAAVQSRQQRSYAQRQSLPQQQQSAAVASKQNGTAYPSQQASQASSADELPAGWIALQDPNSGQTYSANQSTGETTWERPQAPSSAQPAPVAVYQPQESNAQVAQQQQQPSQQYQQTNGATASTPSRLVSKYGDGFVTSSSHPELGQQYGNVGTR
jgi:protein transport protein SEC31